MYHSGWEDVDNAGGCACVRDGGIWELSAPSPQFCLEPKTILKNGLKTYTQT